jgi:hypothetical protein
MQVNEAVEDDQYRSIVNPAKGEAVGERQLPSPACRSGGDSPRR